MAMVRPCSSLHLGTASLQSQPPNCTCIFPTCGRAAVAMTHSVACRAHVRLGWHNPHHALATGTGEQQAATDPRWDHDIWPFCTQGWPRMPEHSWVSRSQEVWRSTQDLDPLTADFQSIHYYCRFTSLTNLTITHQDEMGCRERSFLHEQLPGETRENTKGSISKRWTNPLGKTIFWKNGC